MSMKGSAGKVCTVRFEPSGLKTEVAQGTLLLDAARKVGYRLVTHVDCLRNKEE